MFFASIRCWFCHFLICVAVFCIILQTGTLQLDSKERRQHYIKKSIFPSENVATIGALERKKHTWIATMHEIVCSLSKQSSLCEWLCALYTIKHLAVEQCHLKVCICHLKFIFHLLCSYHWPIYFQFNGVDLESQFLIYQPDNSPLKIVFAYWLCISWLYMICASFS